MCFKHNRYAILQSFRFTRNITLLQSIKIQYIDQFFSENLWVEHTLSAVDLLQ